MAIHEICFSLLLVIGATLCIISVVQAILLGLDCNYDNRVLNHIYQRRKALVNSRYYVGYSPRKGKYYLYKELGWKQLKVRKKTGRLLTFKHLHSAQAVIDKCNEVRT